MLTFSASQAKQNFGALMGHLAQSPVAIERHQKIVAIVMSPDAAAAIPSLHCHHLHHAGQFGKVKMSGRRCQIPVELVAHDHVGQFSPGSQREHGLVIVKRFFQNISANGLGKQCSADQDIGVQNNVLLRYGCHAPTASHRPRSGPPGQLGYQRNW